MNRSFLKGLLILACLSSIASICYAWPEVDIGIYPYRHYRPLGDFEANEPNSSIMAACGSGGPIETWEWYWPSGAYAKSQTDLPYSSTIRFRFSSTGRYSFGVIGYNEFDHWDCDNCLFYVFEMDLDIEDVNDDDEEDPGGYVCVNDDELVSISLSYEPSSLYPGYIELNIPHGGTSYIRVWEDPNKQNMVIPDGSKHYKRWWVGTQPSTLYVEGYYVGTAELYLLYSNSTDPNAPVYPGGIYKHDKVNFSVLDVDLLINNTYAETDDYVVMEKTSGERTTPVNTPAGATDNHIPMTVYLDGPSGFSCKVKLSDSGGGDITIKKTDGSPYPAEGETVTVGSYLEVHIFGTSPSADLNDVTITAKTDKTGDSICGQEDLTVIWVYGSDMSFRGSDQQGQSLTACSIAKFTNVYSWMYNKVGKFIYKHHEWDSAYYQEELKIQTSPNEVISDVEWDIRREVSGVYWGPGADPRSPGYKGETDWADDSPGGIDEDVIQNPTCKEIFSIDCPGSLDLPYTAGFKYNQKAKFREWVEVKIGTNWYVCSPYKEWRMIMHVKFQDATNGWVEDTSKTNEIVVGTIDGWAGSWSED